MQGFRNFLRNLKSLSWWNSVPSRTRHVSRNVAKCIGFPIFEKMVQKFIPVTVFSELGDWIVPKIGLYLQPISADNPMEHFFGNFHFQLISGTFSMKFWSIFEKSSKSHPKSPRNRLKIEISKKGSIGSSALMGWRYKPILGAIQSSSSEKTVPTLNFKAKFYNMGNPIHFATFRETCRVRDGTEFHHDKLFKFRKKFLNPCIPNF